VTTLLEIVGVVAVVVAGWLVDFRLGLAAAGVALVAAGWLLGPLEARWRQKRRTRRERVT
jgi:hypothetical protein